MKVKQYVSLTLVLVLLLSLLAGCGASSMDSAVMNAAAPEEMMEFEVSNSSLTTNSGSGSTTLPENRKWIITVDMSAETEDLDALLEALDEKISELEGYLEDQNIYNGSTYSSRRYRYANLTIRIPADDVEEFTDEVSGISNVVRSNKSQEDVTLSYTATESRVKALQTEEARLLELMEQAENMSDLLEIEERLTDVRYELERYTSQLRTYDNKIDYATINLNIEEVQEYTPVKEETLWERISGGFVSSLKDLGNALVEILVWILVNSPYLVVWAILAAVVIVLLKRRKKHKAEKKQPPFTVTEPEKKEE